MEAITDWLLRAPWWQVVPALLVENVVVLGVALAFGLWLVRRYAHRRVALPPRSLTRVEVAITASTVLLNTAVTLVGLVLWRLGVIRFRTDAGWRAWLDVLVLLLMMDLAMYLLHRAAHHPMLYPWLHRLHHDYDRPRPLTLFVLNPAENLAFGLLWLTVIWAYSASWLGMSVYLVLNVLFGTVGHLGVEPVPAPAARSAVLRHLAGSTFHARHHQDLGCNFGFYTLLWDRLFGTLREDYWESFGLLPAWVVVKERGEGALADFPLPKDTK
jgi:sterol desaturase/sphingolipid hydroxylase (fatty acid hydroxylase superfamily)